MKTMLHIISNSHLKGMKTEYHIISNKVQLKREKMLLIKSNMLITIEIPSFLTPNLLSPLQFCSI